MLRRILAILVLAGGLALINPPSANAITYDPCAQLDLSRISDNRDGVTYKYCWKYMTYVGCGDPAKLILVRMWQEYAVGHKPDGCKNHW